MLYKFIVSSNNYLMICLEKSIKRDVSADRGNRLLCLICDNKTRIQIRQNTILKNFPLFCPKFKKRITTRVMSLMVILFGCGNRI